MVRAAPVNSVRLPPRRATPGAATRDPKCWASIGPAVGHDGTGSGVVVGGRRIG
jgi:hypothetical protein